MSYLWRSTEEKNLDTQVNYYLNTVSHWKCKVNIGKNMSGGKTVGARSQEDLSE